MYTQTILYISTTKIQPHASFPFNKHKNKTYKHNYTILHTMYLHTYEIFFLFKKGLPAHFKQTKGKQSTTPVKKFHQRAAARGLRQSCRNEDKIKGRPGNQLKEYKQRLFSKNTKWLLLQFLSPHLLRSILAKSELDKDLVSAVADVLADAGGWAADVPFSTFFTGRFCRCRERGTIAS